MDIGMRVAAAAKAITPQQVAELLAIKLANFHETQVPILVCHWMNGAPCAVLLAGGMIKAENVKGWSSRKWRRARITEFGERVLLSVAEDAMVAQGRMDGLDPPEWSEAA